MALAKPQSPLYLLAAITAGGLLQRLLQFRPGGSVHAHLVTG